MEAKEATSNKVGLAQVLYEDMKTQREGPLSQGFWAIAAYRLMSQRMKVRLKIIRWPWKVVNVFLGKFIQFLTGIEIPESAKIGRRIKIEHFGGIIIHGSSVIGDDCIIRQGVTLGNRTDDRPDEAPILGDRVTINAGAKIIGRVVLGNDVVVGANAVVLTDIPAGRVAVGVPARILPC